MILPTTPSDSPAKNVSPAFYNAVVSICCIVPSLLVSEVAVAAGVSTTPLGGAYLLKMALGLAVVLGAFYLLAKIARQIKGIGDNNPGVLSVLTGVSVGARERLIIVQAGDVQMLLGISPSGIVKLCEFDNEVIMSGEPRSNDPLKTQFKNILDRQK